MPHVMGSVSLLPQGASSRATKKKSRAMSQGLTVNKDSKWTKMTFTSSKEPPACCQNCGTYLEIRKLPKELPGA